MRIVVIVRTRDEKDHIERFCNSYWWADKILVADGGSIDNTVSIAKSYDNVSVRHYHKRVTMNKGHWRNPQGDHLNFLNDWAKDEQADWIILDDCDCVPNSFLQDNGREILTHCEYEFAYAIRLYLWGKDQHFPQMSQPIKKGRYETSLWAWKAHSMLRFENTVNTYTFFPRPKLKERLNIQPPKFLLHYSWVDTEALEKKLTYYRDSGQHSEIQHPLDMAGEPVKLPEGVVP